jgi:hypothetical protein
MKKLSISHATVVLAFLVAFLPAQWAFGWGNDAHKMINRVAVEMLPGGMPGFLRSRHAFDEIEYLGPEPDRWRSSAEPELSAAQAPDHFIDLELADMAAPDGLPRERFEFIRDLDNARKQYPNLNLIPPKVGLLPWQVNEGFQRLEADMHEYRVRAATHQAVYGAEQAILYDAGVLGHYVGDGSQPLHTTIDYNGWVEEENPEHFTRRRGIHSEFEAEFVRDNIRSGDIRPLVPAAPRLLNSPFQNFVAYLRASHGQVPEVYRLEKLGGFRGTGTSQSRGFTAARIAAGAAMLRDMIYTAWIDSATGAQTGRSTHRLTGAGWN